MELTDATSRTAGTLLVAIAAVEYGGIFMFAILRGKKQFTGFQTASFRAGHAHAGVLLILSLVALLYADTLELTGLTRVVARSAIPLAAILMPAGFFFGAMGRGRTGPNRFMSLVYLGALSLATGVVTLGVALLTA
ncbi:MAG: hypothetical protein ACRDWS_11965 [Acidimicrobiia bacterium]